MLYPKIKAWYMAMVGSQHRYRYLIKKKVMKEGERKEERGRKRRGKRKEWPDINSIAPSGLNTKELKTVAILYGPVAPFTLSIIETLSDQCLTPCIYTSN